MRYVPIVATLALSFFVAVAPAEDVDHPVYLSWSSRPVGTSVTLRTRTDSQGHVITTTTTTSLKEVTPEKVVLEIRKVSDATGKTVENAPEVVPTFRKFPLFPGVKKEDIGKPQKSLKKGEEEVKLAGKEFKAVWFDNKTKGDGGIDWLTRTWMSDELPGRLLKSVTQIPTAKTTITTELVEFKVP